jgi:hypothetical protein
VEAPGTTARYPGIIHKALGRARGLVAEEAGTHDVVVHGQLA